MRALQSDQGVGVSGLVTVSPLLDAHVQSGFNDPFDWVDRLPTEAAAARALKGPVNRGDLADVEQYAATDFVADLLRGFHDSAAVARLTDHVAALTGIDRAIVARGGGRLDGDVFRHELQRAKGRVSSANDATVSRDDPSPRRPLSQFPDPVLEGLKAPVISAMVAIYTEKLNWRPDAVYQLENDDAFRQWDWGRGIGRPESLSYLQTALSLDPRLHVLIGCVVVRPGHAVLHHGAGAEPVAGCCERRTRPAGGVSGRPHVLFRRCFARDLSGCGECVDPWTLIANSPVAQDRGGRLVDWEEALDAQFLQRDVARRAERRDRGEQP